MASAADSDASLSEHELDHTAAPAGSDAGSEARATVEDGELDSDEDLFGDGGDDDAQPDALPKLDDDDLDSGDDESHNGRGGDAHDAHEDEAEEQTFNFMDADIARHPVPEPSDGELYLLKVPHFLGFEPTAWSHKTFQVPTTDHHSKTAPSESFSPFDTALTTVRWRRSPSNPAELQSNARVLRWSDGSLTLQLASQPIDQYTLDPHLLAPPQIRPKKPTPTSIMQKTGTQYKQGYTYLAAPYEEAQVMRVTNKLTTGLNVVPTATSNDAAVNQLQAALAKAASRTLDSEEQAISFITVNEDPELARARKEAEHKEKLKQQKAKEKSEMKEREKASTRRMGGGARSSGYGLNVGGLEDEEAGRRRKQRAKTGIRRDWSDDEDYGIRGRNKEDEYDEEDDFIAGSDEEEVVEDDEDEDDGIAESPQARRERKNSSPKRSRGGDEDVVVSRTKRRRVVEDDDEDE